MALSELLSGYKSDPKVINGHKYRVNKWNVITVTAEGFKLLKVMTPVVTVIADLKMNKGDVHKELDEIYQEQFSNDFIFTQAFSQVRELLEEEHFLELQHKLLSSIEIKDEEKDEWVKVTDWVDHLSKPEYEGDYLDLMWFSAEVNLVNFMKKQTMLTSLTETVAPLLSKVKESLKGSVS
jgi:RNAse (barnase) inhibitor barstar